MQKNEAKKEHRMKKSLLWGLILLTALGMNAFAWEADDLIPSYANLSAGVNRLEVEPMVQYQSETELAFLWITAKSSISWLEIREKGTPEWIRVHREQNGLLDAGSVLHRIYVDGLKPATRYEFRVQVKTIASYGHCPTYGIAFTSPVFQVSTQDPSKTGTTFAILNDIHQNKFIFSNFIAKVNHKKPEILFLNGDITNMLTKTEDIINYHLKFSGKLNPKIPVYNVRGNHETRGGAAREINQFFYTPNGTIYQLITIGNTTVIMLDTGEDKPDNHKEYAGAVNFDSYRVKETAWIRQAIQSKAWTQATYKIVIGHIPIWHKDDPIDYERSYPWQDEWMQLLNQAKAQVLIAAHTHVSEIVPPGKMGDHHYPIIIGGGPETEGATLMTCTTGNHQIVLERERWTGEKLEPLIIPVP